MAETEPTKKETKQFYEKCSINSNMRFYQIDISDEALKFSEEMNLCEKGINVNLDDEKVELLESLPKIDVVIATGCIGYIGYMAFVNLLKLFFFNKCIVPDIPKCIKQKEPSKKFKIIYFENLVTF